MFMLMLFMFCFFLGFLAMFFYLLGRLDRQAKMLSDEHAQLRVLLRALESRLDKMVQREKVNAILQGQSEAEAALPGERMDEEGATQDPLLHLSFDRPRHLDGNLDPGLALDLDTGVWGKMEKDQPSAQD